MGADERRRPARLTGWWWSVLLIIGLGLALQAGPAGAGEKILAQLPLDKVESLATVLALDSEITAEGKSAVKIISPGPASICLGLIENLQVEDAGQAYKLVYQAQVRARDLKGNAFLEMWCFFGSDGPYFSRGLNSYITGTTDWTTLTTPFFLQPGQTPTRITLNLYVNGSGTLWVDDIRLIKAAPSP